MRAAIIIPVSKPLEDTRHDALARIFRHYRDEHSELNVYISQLAGPWCKALAVAGGVDAAADADILVIADADCWTPPDDLSCALAAVASGRHDWAMPHRLVYRLAEGQLEPTESRAFLAQIPYTGVVGGGITVIRRDVYLRHPLDPRFALWGGEDISWGLTLKRLAGPQWQGIAKLYHLWHTPADTHNRATDDTRDLLRRYIAADAKETARLSAEARELTWPS